jgi:hypothetical protein
VSQLVHVVLMVHVLRQQYLIVRVHTLVIGQLAKTMDANRAKKAQ